VYISLFGIEVKTQKPSDILKVDVSWTVVIYPGQSIEDEVGPDVIGCFEHIELGVRLTTVGL